MFISASDDPFDGIDANCDGKDGDPEDAVYVNGVLGSATGSGEIDDPLDSIQDGIDRQHLWFGVRGREYR